MDKKILVVDDEVPILMLLSETFEQKGYEVVTAQNAEEALEILKKEKFKVMFLDLKLPGMNGVELCKVIRKDFPESSIYAITGYPDKFEFKACMEAGFNGYFTKPLTMELLLETAGHAFEERVAGHAEGMAQRAKGKGRADRA